MTEITRQHLEDAALAAGMEVLRWKEGTPIVHDGGELAGWWEPAFCDVDSRWLQIAVKATLSVCRYGRNIAEAWCVQLGPMVTSAVLHDGTPSDAARAAREAVVLCAAEVGRRMREEGS
jgi:hypothetical protein